MSKKAKKKEDPAAAPYEEVFEMMSHRNPGLREGVARELEKMEEREQRKKRRRQTSSKS